MANDNQIAVKKRLIYAEDLFEPVDYTVFYMGGRSGGKTLAMYEQLFRKRVELAPTIDAVEVVRCKDCTHYDERYRTVVEETGNVYCGGYCYHWDYEAGMSPNQVDGDDFCSYGERRTDNGK